MAKKRGNHEGSIYKRKNGTWRTQITIEGIRIGSSFKTQHEARAWIIDMRNQINAGLSMNGRDINLQSFLNNWLETILNSRAISTYDRYKWVVEHRINPILGDVKVSDLSPDRIQNAYRKMKNNGLSNHAILQSHKVLNVALNHAIKMGLMGRNPCKGTTPPKPIYREMKFYDEHQVKLLLDAAKMIDDRLYPFFYITVHSGLRQSELTGLKWEDINWESNTLQVKRQVLFRAGKNFQFTKPKSRSGNRTLIMGNKAMEILTLQKQMLEYHKKEKMEEWEDLNLIFPSKVGTPMMPCNIRRSFSRLVKIAQLPKIRFHDLRHTAASLMLNHGIPLLVASKRLGHSKPSITLDIYGHLLPSKQKEAAHLLDQLLS